MSNVNNVSISLSIEEKKKSSKLSEYFAKVNKDEFAKKIYKHSKEVEKIKNKMFQNTFEYNHLNKLDYFLSKKLINNKSSNKASLENNKHKDFHQFFLDQNLDLIKNKINTQTNLFINKSKKLQSNKTVIFNENCSKTFMSNENDDKDKDVKKNKNININDEDLKLKGCDYKSNIKKIKRNLLVNTDTADAADKKIKFVLNGKYFLRGKNNNSNTNNVQETIKTTNSNSKNFSNSNTIQNFDSNLRKNYEKDEKIEKIKMNKIKPTRMILKEQKDRMKAKTSNFLVYGNYLSHEKQKNEVILEKLKTTITNFEKDFKEDDPVLQKVKNFLSTVSAPESNKNGTYYQVGQGFETLSSKKSNKTKIISDEKFNIFYRLFFYQQFIK